MANYEHYLQTAPQTGTTDNLEKELEGLPEKLKGKSAKDIAQMYLDLEQVTSRQGNELGELRKLVTNLSAVQPVAEPVKPKEEVQQATISADELLADPNKSLEKVIDTHPAVVKAREKALELERQAAANTFQQEYPEYQKDLNDPNFVEWVKKNPARSNLIQQANNYDLNAARALWDMWGEHKGLVGAAEAKATEAEKRRQAEQAATLESSTGATASEETVYSRAELQDLQRRALLGDRKAKAKWEDPVFREARLRAYAEGRVK